LLALCACSAPASLPDLAAAEHLSDTGDLPGAVAAYHRAQASCHALRPARRARAACSDAYLGEADALDHAGRGSDAIAAYLAIPAHAQADEDATLAATATYRAGELELHAGQTVAAWTALWRVVTDYPDEPLAADALRDLLLDGRGRDARAMADQIEKLLTPLAATDVGDNLLWSLADLDEHELGNLPAARAIYDRIPIDYPTSGLRDDARWRAAQVSVALHDPRGAVERLRGLLATREVAIGPGSYFSIWLDDAQLQLGQILRDELGDLPGAAAAFRQLPRDYPASILRDDALYELAVTLSRAHDAPGACDAIAKLRVLEPDSKYRARADALAQELACKS
jgi:tetratricopeptide (TPR) repeat protein